jgi:lysophospholipase L1-like esterase
MTRRTIYLAAVFALLSFAADKKTIRVWLLGDSTMSIKDVRAYPETGWGMPFAYFFDSTVKVENRAKNGRSTKTFITEQLWQYAIDNMGEGDYVFIQFGHNDEVPEKVNAYTTPEQFTANLKMFVIESRKKGASPVLITPVARRRFDSTGRVVETHLMYSGLVRSLAGELKVPLIDLDRKSQELYQQLGVEASKLLFVQLQPGEHPNYPKGKEDNTHFSELGARLIAQIVLKEIKELKLELADRIVKR